MTDFIHANSSAKVGIQLNHAGRRGSTRPRQEGLDREVLSLLALHDRVDVAHEDRSRERWTTFVRLLTAPRRRQITIGITGKYVALRDAYASIDKALEHCSAQFRCDIAQRWIETSEFDQYPAEKLRENVEKRLRGLDAVIVPGGFGSRGVEGKIACVRHCREQGLPYLGICLGFQVAVIEFARHVMGLTEASSSEFDPEGAVSLIAELPEQKRIEGLGGTMRLGAQDVVVEPGSLAAFLYRDRLSAGGTVRERFRHRYEVDPAYVERLEAAGLRFSGRHPGQPIMQILELPPSAAGAVVEGAEGPAVTHPYFIGSQFHPELTSRPLSPQPLFMGLVAAALRQWLEQFSQEQQQKLGASLRPGDALRGIPFAAVEASVSGVLPYALMASISIATSSRFFSMKRGSRSLTSSSSAAGPTTPRS